MSVATGPCVQGGAAKDLTFLPERSREDIVGRVKSKDMCSCPEKENCSSGPEVVSGVSPIERG